MSPSADAALSHLPPFRDWFATPPSHPRRSLDLVRVTAALILIVHPIYTLLHPAARQQLAQLIASHHLVWSQGLPWVVCLLQIACSLALLANRGLLPATAGHVVVLAAGMGMTQFTHWYTVGGAAEDGIPGIEFNVMLLICLVGVLWGRLRSASQGLDAVRVGAALVLLMHPLHGVFDPVGLRGFGQGLEHVGFRHGLFLVWTTMVLQLGCSLALLARRLVVPAVIGHVTVLGMGIWIAHAPHWFVVGPGEGGMEYSLLLILCFVAVAIAHWPAPARPEGLPKAEALP